MEGLGGYGRRSSDDESLATRLARSNRGSAGGSFRLEMESRPWAQLAWASSQAIGGSASGAQALLVLTERRRLMWKRCKEEGLGAWLLWE